jgi:cytoskeletal protein CcmA (bactofilin family)
LGFLQEVDMIDENESRIGPSMVITGEVESKARVSIAGKLEGSFSGPDLLVEETGQLIGLVCGEKIECFGRIEGKVFAKSLDLRSTGCQAGTCETQKLTVEPGAVLDCVLQSGTSKGRVPAGKVVKITHNK